MKLTKISKDKLEAKIAKERKELKEMVSWIDEWEDFDQRSLLYEQIIKKAFELRKLNKCLKRLNINLRKEQITNMRATN